MAAIVVPVKFSDLSATQREQILSVLCNLPSSPEVAAVSSNVQAQMDQLGGDGTDEATPEAQEQREQLERVLEGLKQQPTLALTSASGRGGTGGVYATVGPIADGHPVLDVVASDVQTQKGRQANGERSGHPSSRMASLDAHANPALHRSGLASFLHPSKQRHSQVSTKFVPAGGRQGTSSFLSSQRDASPSRTQTPKKGRRVSSRSRSPSILNGRRTVVWTSKLIEDFLSWLARKPYVLTGTSVGDLVTEFLSDRCGLPNLVRTIQEDLLHYAAEYAKLCPLCRIFNHYVTMSSSIESRTRIRIAADLEAAASLLLPEDQLAKAERLHYLANVRTRLSTHQVSQSQKATAYATSDERSQGALTEHQYLVPRKYIPLDLIITVVKKILGRNNKEGKNNVVQWLDSVVDEEDHFISLVDTGSGKIHNPDDPEMRNYNPLVLDLPEHVDLFELADAITAAYFLSVQLASGFGGFSCHRQSDGNAGGEALPSMLHSDPTMNVDRRVQGFDEVPMSPEYTARIANSAKKRALEQSAQGDVSTAAGNPEQILNSILSDPALKLQLAEALKQQHPTKMSRSSTISATPQKNSEVGSKPESPLTPTQRIATSLKKDPTSTLTKKLQLSDPRSLSGAVKSNGTVRNVGSSPTEDRDPRRNIIVGASKVIPASTPTGRRSAGSRDPSPNPAVPTPQQSPTGKSVGFDGKSMWRKAIQSSLAQRSPSRQTETSQQSSHTRPAVAVRSRSGGDSSLLKEVQNDYDAARSMSHLAPVVSVPKMTTAEAAELLAEEKNRYSVYRNRLKLGGPATASSSAPAIPVTTDPSLMDRTLSPPSSRVEPVLDTQVKPAHFMPGPTATEVNSRQILSPLPVSGSAATTPSSLLVPILSPKRRKDVDDALLSPTETSHVFKETALSQVLNPYSISLAGRNSELRESITREEAETVPVELLEEGGIGTRTEILDQTAHNRYVHGRYSTTNSPRLSRQQSPLNPSLPHGTVPPKRVSTGPSQEAKYSALSSAELRAAEDELMSQLEASLYTHSRPDSPLQMDDGGVPVAPVPSASPESALERLAADRPYRF